jgi:hypothetical protein
LVSGKIPHSTDEKKTRKIYRSEIRKENGLTKRDGRGRRLRNERKIRGKRI